MMEQALSSPTHAPEHKHLGWLAVIPVLAAASAISITIWTFLDADRSRQRSLAEVRQMVINPLTVNPFGPNAVITKAEAENSLLVPIFDQRGRPAQCYFKTTDGRVSVFANPFVQDEMSGLKLTRSALTCQEVKPAFINGLQ
jgi:hypothetical protein